MRPRVGVQPCRFCKAESIDEDAPLSQVFGSASGEVSVTDEDGKSTGVVGGKLVQEIPGAVALPSFSEDGLWGDNAPMQLFIPTGKPHTFALQGRVGLSDTETSTLGIVEPGHAVVLENVLLKGRRDTLKMSADLSSVAYTSKSRSALTLSLVQTLPGGREVEATIRTPAGAVAVKTEMDPVTGDVSVGVTMEDGEEAEVGLGVTRSSPEGEETFEGTVEVPSGGDAALDVQNWAGEGSSMAVAVDENGDGTTDRETTTADSGPAGTAPEAPTALLAATTNSAPPVELTWTDNARTETSFEIERADDGAPFAPLATLGANTTAFSDPTAR